MTFKKRLKQYFSPVLCADLLKSKTMSRISKPGIWILTVLTMTGCTKTSVDLIVQNGKIYTVDSLFTVAESFAVNDGKIVATGSTREISETYDARQVIDLGGKFVYPGFNDAHCHFYGYGMNLLRYADLSGTQSPEEIYEILKKHQEQYGRNWLLGRGWDQNDWPGKTFPDKSRLDELFPDVAVYLIRIDGHAAWCNSRALELAGITAATSVEGGQVLLQNGEPTGILIDKAEEQVARVVPHPTPEQEEAALLEAQKSCLAAGLTSLTDCGVPLNVIRLMDKLQKEEKLKLRVNAMMNPDSVTLDHFVKNGLYKTDRLRVGTIKLYADGALGSRGALLLEPYSDDPSNQGLQMEPAAYYDSICSLARQHNWQVATHCIGDSANRLILNIYGKFLQSTNDRRWRIEHAQVVHPADFDQFARYSVIPSVQATHAISDMEWAVQRLGKERLKNSYAYQKLLQQMGWLPNGTDFPIEKISPVLTFYAAVFRTNLEGKPEKGFQPENALTREQALRSITGWPARASFEELEKGSIESGKWADFVVLDTDLMEAPPAQVAQARVTQTWIAGVRLF